MGRGGFCVLCFIWPCQAAMPALCSRMPIRITRGVLYLLLGHVWCSYQNCAVGCLFEKSHRCCMFLLIISIGYTIMVQQDAYSTHQRRLLCLVFHWASGGHTTLFQWDA